MISDQISIIFTAPSKTFHGVDYSILINVFNHLEVGWLVVSFAHID